MAATAEKVTPIEEGKGLMQFGKALVKFDIKEQVLQDLEEATRLEITDAASEKVVRKHRQNAKSIQVRIEKTRLQLNREFKEKTDKAAALIAPRVAAAYDKLDEKVRAIETEREARKAEKEEAECLRLGKIQWRMDGLEYDCSAGLEYNLPYPDIAHCLNTLHDIKISAVDFQEQTEKAEQMLAEAIVKTECAYTDRLDWEEQQAELEKKKAEQEAEAKRLAEENAKLEAEKARVEKVQSIFTSVTERSRLYWNDPAQLDNHWQGLEVCGADPELFKERSEEYNQFRVSEMAIIKDRLHELAIVDHNNYLGYIDAEIDKLRADAKARWEATQQAQAEAAARAKLVEPDKKTLTGMLTVVDNFISDFSPADGEYKTDEAAQIELDLIVKIKKAIEEAAEAMGALR